MPKQKTVTTSSEKYRDRWVYTFPIAAVVGKYGRIEVNVEPVAKAGRLVSLLVWFRQHQIKEYEGVVFKIPLPKSGQLMSLPTSDGSLDFLALSHVTACAEHRGLILSSHPRDGVTALVVFALSTISSIEYK